MLANERCTGAVVRHYCGDYFARFCRSDSFNQQSILKALRWPDHYRRGQPVNGLRSMPTRSNREPLQ